MEDELRACTRATSTAATSLAYHGHGTAQHSLTSPGDPLALLGAGVNAQDRLVAANIRCNVCIVQSISFSAADCRALEQRKRIPELGQLHLSSPSFCF